MAVVPRIRPGPEANEPPRSDLPTYLLMGVTILAAFCGGVAGGFRLAVLAGLAMLIVGGGLYSLAARLFGWPRLRWDAVPLIIP